MNAVRLHAFGPPENLTYEEVSDPVPGADQVLIAVEVSGVHLLDTIIRRGLSGGPFPLPDLPAIPGREVAGTVAAAGPGVDERWTGRRVVAHLGQASGGYAELAVAPVRSLHDIPDHVAADQAVAMIGTGRTAMGILDVAQLSAGDVVLVTAAAGGLGCLLVQAARNAGALVVGVGGGPAKTQRILALGANVAVDYLLADWPDRVRDALGDLRPSVVLDGVGGSQGRAAMQLLRSGGRLVLFGWSSGEPTPVTTGDIFAGGLTVTAAVGPRMLERPGGLRDFEDRSLEVLAAGRLVPVVGQRWPLAQAPAAHTAVETRATMGKTVLVP